MVELYNKYGLRPYADLLGGKPYYFHLVLAIGDRLVRIVPPENLGEAGLKTTLIDGLKRAAPGFTRVVGMWTPPAGPPVPGMQGMPQQGMPPPQTFQRVRQALSGNYEVRDVPLTLRVPDDVEVLGVDWRTSTRRPSSTSIARDAGGAPSPAGRIASAWATACRSRRSRRARDAVHVVGSPCSISS
jgi:hypothetical protein